MHARGPHEKALVADAARVVRVGAAFLVGRLLDAGRHEGRRAGAFGPAGKFKSPRGEFVAAEPGRFVKEPLEGIGKAAAVVVETLG